LKVEEFSGNFIPFRCSRIHLGEKSIDLRFQVGSPVDHHIVRQSLPLIVIDTSPLLVCCIIPFLF